VSRPRTFGLAHPEFLKWCETIAWGLRYDAGSVDTFAVSLVIGMMNSLGFTVAPPDGDAETPAARAPGSRERQRVLVRLLQIAASEDATADWRELVSRARSHGQNVVPPPRPWEFDRLRTTTIAALFSGQDPVDGR
jgi:hypothetical protein